LHVVEQLQAVHRANPPVYETEEKPQLKEMPEKEVTMGH
jgi:hypothetical protein